MNIENRQTNVQRIVTQMSQQPSREQAVLLVL
jgi:hypothetical protein